MQNEGASKGILVTTSGYGHTSHDFANGKPLELSDGANLLYLLKEPLRSTQKSSRLRIGSIRFRTAKPIEKRAVAKRRA